MITDGEITETILLVDDEDAVRRAAHRILARPDRRVIEATSGEQALDLLAQMGSSVDLLVSDLVMPGISGADLARRFRTDHPAGRVILMSGFAADRPDGRPALPIADGDFDGDFELLPKPFTRDTLLDAVNGGRPDPRAPGPPPPRFRPADPEMLHAP